MRPIDVVHVEVDQEVVEEGIDVEVARNPFTDGRGVGARTVQECEQVGVVVDAPAFEVLAVEDVEISGCSVEVAGGEMLVRELSKGVKAPIVVVDPEFGPHHLGNEPTHLSQGGIDPVVIHIPGVVTPSGIGNGPGIMAEPPKNEALE